MEVEHLELGAREPLRVAIDALMSAAGKPQVPAPEKQVIRKCPPHDVIMYYSSHWVPTWLCVACSHEEAVNLDIYPPERRLEVEQRIFASREKAREFNVRWKPVNLAEHLAPEPIKSFEPKPGDWK